MAKLTVEAAHADLSVTDSTGRVLTIKRPNVLAQYRLVEALGDAADNRAYLRMCLPLLYLTTIDGEPVVAPKTKAQMEAIIQRLDDAGIDALHQGINEHFAAEASDSAKK